MYEIDMNTILDAYRDYSESKQVYYDNLDYDYDEEEDNDDE